MNEQEKQQLQDLLNWKKNMESSFSIPLNVDQSFRARFAFSSLKASTKDPSTETATIDEGGAAIKTVLDNPDAFLEVIVGSTTYYIPVFT